MSTNQSPVPVCKICTRPFEDPRILSCLHSFCQACLEKELAKTPGNIITCPTCQRSVPIPEGGVISLPKNLHLTFEVEVASYIAAMETTSSIKCSSCSVESNGPSKAFCCTCREFLCQFCWDYHKASRKLQDHVTMPLTKEVASKLPSLMKPSVSTCAEHGEAMKFYCKVCDRPVCQACITSPQSALTSNSQHAGHSYVGMDTAASSYRRELVQAIKFADSVLVKLSNDMSASDDGLLRAESMRRSVAFKVETSFSVMEEALCAKKAAILASLDKATQACEQPFRDRKVECCSATTDVTQRKEVISHALDSYTDDELMVSKRLFTLALEDAFKCSENFLSTSLQSSLIVTPFTPTHKILEEIEKFSLLLICASMSSWTQVQTSPPMVNTQYQVKLVSRDSKGERVTSGGLDVAAELRPKMANQPCTKGEVEDCGDGTYAITFTPLTAGHHQLSITIHGHHVFNSPCDLIVLKNYTCWKSVEMTIAVENPFFVATDSSGNIYVTSGGDFAVHIFDAAGRLKLTVGERGNGDGQFNNPRGIAVKGDVMYIADYSNNRVQKLTTVGAFLLSFGHQGSGVHTPLRGPLGVCVDPEERVIVSDYGNHMVQLYSPSGVHLHTINGNSNVARFTCPCAVALDLQGNIHIGTKPTAQQTAVVAVFTPKGDYLRSYGALRNATSIGVHRAGYCAVCEYGKRNNVLIFSSSGEQLVAMETESNAFAVAFDEYCNLYVTMLEANKLVKY